MATMISMNGKVSHPIVDVQNRHDTRHVAIQKAGTKGVTYPITFLDANNSRQHTLASFDLAVDVLPQFKGTHMSRFIEVVHEINEPFSVGTLQKMLKTIVARQNAEHGYIDVHFPYFLTKKAPVSGVASVLEYTVSLHGEIHPGLSTINYTVTVPVTSLCPCSKEISEYGAHNQRAYITLQVASQEILCLAELITLVEKQGSCELYSTLKRSDEKYITEKAYENPKFVEDIVRDLALVLEKETRIVSYRIEAESLESIHNHSAYAVVVSDN